jgi:hypothetical protein
MNPSRSNDEAILRELNDLIAKPRPFRDLTLLGLRVLILGEVVAHGD